MQIQELGGACFSLGTRLGARNLFVVLLQLHGLIAYRTAGNSRAA
uniref:Uncharacterized protein n=1 Tax=Arundo donax TaxID=35708 RepID=A0A0A9C3Y0_ARUDO